MAGAGAFIEYAVSGDDDLDNVVLSATIPASHTAIIVGSTMGTFALVIVAIFIIRFYFDFIEKKRSTRHTENIPLKDIDNA